MKSLNIFAVFLGFVVFTEASFKSKPLPSYITACKRADPNAGDCAKNSAIAAITSILKGDKQYKIPKLSPMKVPKLVLSSGENLKLTLTDVSVFGLEDIEIKTLTIDPVKRHGDIVVKAPWINVDSQYEINGQILILPITGNGPANLTFYDATVNYEMDYDLVKRKDDKEYIHITKSTTDIEIPKAYFHLENLFNGNKALADHMNMFLNENSKDVVKDLGIPVLTELVQVLVTQVLNSVLNVVPYDEVLPV